ncbi:CAP domain-containing protein [Kitasatospora sp. NBC_01287]|uniref:CAP domain-containing protein n=1 Tax=Kitasatospora sp. NBC_01287 TaxID=2903573 RepID=UPI00225B9F40|nr:CAP domain-containing protein [Kitasatospora sp. NBC_01287]MCX4751063.1 CAP domain-containing protein [Kitasatospora sp. NBC_01287]
MPGAKPLLAAVALAATATTVVVGGRVLSPGPQDGTPLSAPEPQSGAGAPATTASGSPSATAGTTAAATAPTTGPARLPGAGASTVAVSSPVAVPSSKGAAPLSPPPAAASPAPAGAGSTPLPAASSTAPAGTAPAPAPAPTPSSTTGAVPVPAPSSTPAAGADPALDAAAAQVLAVLNQARAAQGLAPLQMLAGLQTSADAHNHTMAGGCGLEHQCPGEPAFGARENAAGVQWTAAGENIGEGGPVADTTAAIAGMAVGLTNSMLAEQAPNDGHRRNILDPSFHHVGVELWRDSSGTVWMTQDFAD